MHTNRNVTMDIAIDLLNYFNYPMNIWIVL